ncbi:hypothetical protein TcWFU_004688 [Taenia crassiceps]|uniref:Uncharacterized protein n=1 Tax=Taenia crassiceps TaxID=6207 RepID=A0ABR4QDX0_9CEST
MAVSLPTGFNFGTLTPSFLETLPIANRVPRNSESILMPRCSFSMDCGYATINELTEKALELTFICPDSSPPGDISPANGNLDIVESEPLPRVSAQATPPSGPHSGHVRHLEEMPVGGPHHIDGEVNDAACRSRVDSHRSLHQMQLSAIRKFFDESESNFKDKHGTTDEVGSSDTNADRCCQDKQKVSRHPKKMNWPIMKTKCSESQRSSAKIEDESIEASNPDDENEPLWAELKKHREERQNAVTKPLLKSTNEGYTDSIGKARSATDSADAESKWKATWQGEGEKPLSRVRLWCQKPSSTLIPSATVQSANSGEVSNQKEASVNSRNKQLPLSNSVCGEISRYSSRVPKETNLSSENPSNLSSNSSGKEADLPSHTIGRAFTDLSPLREVGYRRVMDAVKQFEIKTGDASKSTNLKSVSRTEESKFSPKSLSVYSLNLAANSYARRSQEAEGDQEEKANKRIDSTSTQKISEALLLDKERLTQPHHYRPVGGIDIYTTQGPKLMQEMKDRFRKKQGASYLEPEPKCRPQSASEIGQPTFPKSEKSLDDVQGLAPLPANLSNDLSHILPSVLKERPKRPGRLPSRYASQLLPADTQSHNRGSTNSTEV